jgi:hypothetical protein
VTEGARGGSDGLAGVGWSASAVAAPAAFAAASFTAASFTASSSFAASTLQRSAAAPALTAAALHRFTASPAFAAAALAGLTATSFAAFAPAALAGLTAASFPAFAAPAPFRTGRRFRLLSAVRRRLPRRRFLRQEWDGEERECESDNRHRDRAPCVCHRGPRSVKRPGSSANHLTAGRTGAVD